MKQLTYLIMLAVLLGSVIALDECQSVNVPSDVPCTIKSTWAYENCILTEVKVYNSTPELLFTTNFTEYGVSGRCNITWNISTVGSYFYNVSNGDSGTLTIQYEVDTMASLSIMLLVMAITGAVFFLGMKGQFTNNEVANHILKKCMYLIGTWLLLFAITIGVNISENYGLGVTDILFQLLWFCHFGAYIFTIILMWTAIQGSLTLWKVKKLKERMGYE